MHDQATNYDPEMISKINEVLEFSINNPCSNFYKTKYQDQPITRINSLKDFQLIPFLEKSELLETKVSERTFMPDEKISYFSFSSGTTKTPLPLIMPRAKEDFKFDECLFEKLDVTRIILLLQPTSSLFRKVLTNQNTKAKIIPGNTQNLPLVAKIIKELDIDGIMTTPTILNSLIKELDNINFNFSSIKWISIGSEFCSTLNFSFLQSRFNKAYFKMRYGNSEIGGTRHYRCEHLACSGVPNIFHPNSNVELLEIINQNNNKILPLGEYGEIVHTDLKLKPAPLLRYKTRDIGKIEKRDCPCGNKFILTIGGKKDYDILKLHGATIHAELIASSLNKVQDAVESLFQLHVFEEILNGYPKPKLVIHLKLRNAYENDAKNEIFKEIIKEKISSNLKLSAGATLADFVNNGMFLPLEIQFVDKWQRDGIKTKSIISHLD